MVKRERPSEAALRRRLVERQTQFDATRQRSSRFGRWLSRNGGSSRDQAFPMRPLGPPTLRDRLRRRPMTVFLASAFLGAGLLAGGLVAWNQAAAPSPAAPIAVKRDMVGRDTASRDPVAANPPRSIEPGKPDDAPRDVAAGPPEDATTRQPTTARRASDAVRDLAGRSSDDDPAITQNAVEAALALRMPEDTIRRESDAASRLRDAIVTGEVDADRPLTPDTLDDLRGGSAAIAAPGATEAADRAEDAAETDPPSVTTASVNLREAPENDARILAVLAPNTTVRVLECEGWCEVEAGENTGYVYRSFIDPVPGG